MTCFSSTTLCSYQLATCWLEMRKVAILNTPSEVQFGASLGPFRRALPSLQFNSWLAPIEKFYPGSFQSFLNKLNVGRPSGYWARANPFHVPYGVNIHPNARSKLFLANSCKGPSSLQLIPGGKHSNRLSWNLGFVPRFRKIDRQQQFGIGFITKTV
jgi:hypothetical protein